MADYKQNILSGQKYNRFSTITIHNPKGSQAGVSVREEQVLSLDGEEITRYVGELSKAFNPAESFHERDPVTGDLTGKTLLAYDVYKAIYSYVIQMAVERDAKVVADELAAKQV